MTGTLEYVSSGNNALKLVGPFILSRPENIEIVKQYFSRLQTSHEGHRFGMLYNALIEPDLGKRMRETYGDVLHSIHADSGGLQEVTQGIKIADKRDIYKMQHLYADVAMSFDEIPVELPDGKSTVQGGGRRFFVKAMVADCAKKSGENLRDQLRYFAENNSRAKAYLIVQGNDLASYQQWLDGVWDVIRNEDLTYLAGIAAAGAALGPGVMEDYERGFVAAHLHYPEELSNLPIHVLGVGSIMRMVPFLVQEKIKDRHISYDSTSFTKSMFNGNFYPGWRTQNYTGNHREDAETLLPYVNGMMEKTGLPLTTVELLQKYQTEPGADRIEHMTTDKAIEDFCHTRSATFASMVMRFYEECTAVRDSGGDEFIFRFAPKILPAVRDFAVLRDQKDFSGWKGKYSSILRSNRYPCKETYSTYELF